MARPTPGEVIASALAPGLKGGILENRVARILNALTSAGYVFTDADTIRQAALPDGAILRATVLVRPNSTATQLTIAPGAAFPDAAAAVERAVKSLTAERDESWRCPANRSGVQS